MANEALTAGVATANPWAIAGGVGVGALSGGVNNVVQGRNYNATMRGINSLRATVPGQSQELMRMLSETYGPYTQNAASDYNAYREGVQNADYDQFKYGATDPFAYDLNAKTQGFLDPTMNQQIQAATGAVEGSAANRGKLFSSATGKAISDRASEIAKQSWKDAAAMAMQDRNFEYGKYGSDIDRARQAQDQAAQLYGTKMQGLGTLAGMGTDMVGQFSQGQQNIKGNEFGTLNELQQQKNMLRMQKPGGFWSGVLQGGLNSFGAIMGG